MRVGSHNNILTETNAIRISEFGTYQRIVYLILIKNQTYVLLSINYKNFKH